MGRPTRANGAATRRFAIRLTLTEERAWQAAAAAEGLNLTEWLRAAAELAIARGSTR